MPGNSNSGVAELSARGKSWRLRLRRYTASATSAARESCDGLSLRILSCHELLVGRHCVGGIHQGWPTAHIHRHTERLFHLLARGSEPHQSLGMKADAALTARGDAERQGDQLLGFFIERAAPRSRLR